MAGLVWVQWYATMFRKDSVRGRGGGDGAARPALRRHPVLRSTLAATTTTRSRRWPGSSPRRTGTATGRGRRWSSSARRNSGHYQVPIVYAWHDEIASGALGAGGRRRTPEPDARSRSPARGALSDPRRDAALRGRIPPRAARARARSAASGSSSASPNSSRSRAEPVARGLRVDAEPLGDLSEPALLGEPHAQRLGQPRARAGRQLGAAAPAGRRRAPARAAVAAQQQLAGVLARRRPAPACRVASASAARARAKLSAACGHATVVPSPATAPASSDRPLELGAAPGAVGVGDERARHLADRLGDRVARQPRDGRVAALAADRHRRQRARQLPAGVGRRRGDGLRVGRRVADEQPHQPAPAQLGLARGGGLLERVALGRLGRQHVDVGEDRLGQQIQRLGLEPGLDAGLRRTAATRPARRSGRR